MVPDQHNLEICIVVINKMKASSSLRLYTGVSKRINDIHSLSKKPQKKVFSYNNKSSTMTPCSAVTLLSSPVNLLPVQTLGLLVQIVSVIKVIMKDTFMLQNIYFPYHQKKKKIKKCNLQMTNKMKFYTVFFFTSVLKVITKVDILTLG